MHLYFAKLGNYQLFRIICIENISQYLICVYLVANYFSKEKRYSHIYRFSDSQKDVRYVDPAYGRNLCYMIFSKGIKNLLSA